MTNLQNFRRMWDEYPRGTSDEVKKRIGGNVDAAWITNTCVIRVCRSLNYAGHPVPVKHPGFATLKGGDGKRYGFRVRELKVYLRGVHGAPAVSHPNPDGSAEPPAPIRGKRGILCFDVTGWTDATGHFDLWDGERCAHHEYFARASKVHLWMVGDGDATAVAPPQTPLRPGAALSGSVGAGGDNRAPDVALVQTLLAARGHHPGPADGAMGPATLAAIKAFQRRFATWPDGRVDPAGRTFRELNKL